MEQDDLIMLVKAMCHAVGVYGDPTASLAAKSVRDELHHRAAHLLNLLSDLEKVMG